MSEAKMPATAAPNLAEILIDWYTDEQDAR